MIIKFNLAAIMNYARDMHRAALARPQIGFDPMRQFADCLRRAWQAAKADRSFYMRGVTAGGLGLCLVVEEEIEDDWAGDAFLSEGGQFGMGA